MILVVVGLIRFGGLGLDVELTIFIEILNIARNKEQPSPPTSLSPEEISGCASHMIIGVGTTSLLCGLNCRPSEREMWGILWRVWRLRRQCGQQRECGPVGK